MKVEILEHIRQYKLEINRKLDQSGNFKHIGFTYTRGKQPCLYWVNKSDGLVIGTFHIAANGKELLLAIQLLLKAINSI